MRTADPLLTVDPSSEARHAARPAATVDRSWLKALLALGLIVLIAGYALGLY